MQSQLSTPRKKPEKQSDFARAAALAEHDECILWPFGVGGNGYGVVYADQVQQALHRFVCGLKRGPAPTPKHEAAHSCGTKLCCNGNHLRWATCSENHADKVGHGRSNRGERQHKAKLTRDEVAYIRVSGLLPATLAKEYGVTERHIYKILARKVWAWL